MIAKNLRRIAAEVASAFDPDLEILAAIPARGGSSYVELLVLDRACGSEPCRVLVGARGASSEATFRYAVLEQLQQLKQHDQI